MTYRHGYTDHPINIEFKAKRLDGFSHEGSEIIQ